VSPLVTPPNLQSAKSATSIAVLKNPVQSVRIAGAWFVMSVLENRWRDWNVFMKDLKPEMSDDEFAETALRSYFVCSTI
jgi:hypothetical protein